MAEITKTGPGSMPYTANSTTYVSHHIDFIRLDPPEPIGTDRGLPRVVELIRGGGMTIVVTGEACQDAVDRIEAEKLTPPSSVLKAMAGRLTPPQEWWDEDFEGL